MDDMMEACETYNGYNHLSITDKLFIAGASLAFSVILTVLVVLAP